MKLPNYVETESQKQTRENNFTYHSPFGDQSVRYGDIRAMAHMLARELNCSCPPSRELSLAMTNLEQAVFWANAAIARNKRNLVDDRPCAQVELASLPQNTGAQPAGD